MRFLGYILIVLLAAAEAVAQRPEARPGQPIEAQALAREVRALQGSSQLSGTAKDSVDKLLADSVPLLSAGRSGEARRLLANALTLLGGRKWDRKEEFVWSLALRPDKVVADSSLPLTVRFNPELPGAVRE